MNNTQAALGDEIRSEMLRQRITAVEMQKRTGIAHASWRNWFVTAKNPAPYPAIVAVCDELGVTVSEMARRAEVAMASRPAPDPIEAELLEGMSPRAREAYLRNRRKDEPVDPPEPATEGNRQAS